MNLWLTAAPRERDGLAYDQADRCGWAVAVSGESGCDLQNCRFVDSAESSLVVRGRSSCRL
jgi:hypothetical protein